LLTLLLGASARGAEETAFFETKVRPLLVERCLECHGEKKQKGGLRLDSKSGWEKGGESGTALVPGKAEESLLIKAISYLDKDLQMPPKKQLALEEVAVLKEWIRRGAPDPRLAPIASAETKPDQDEWADAFQKRLDWWSLKPLRDAALPSVSDETWTREPVDQFIRAGLDGAGLAPASRAEPEVLLRRLSQVLTGLPPAPELRARFLEQWQTDPAATYETLVDELLASPHFGEHFARHWMDVVRYTDTYGYEWDIAAKGSHEYRDYLIRAFNGDVSYRQFVTEQLAGDLLPEPRIDRELGLNESLIGPMFYHLGEHRHGNSTAFNGIHQDMVNNKIDAFSKAFLATTVACSRCHNHKLEAVSQRDYYALAAVFMTPRWISRVVDAPGKNDTAIAKLKELRGALRTALAAQWRAALKDRAWSRAELESAIVGKIVPPATAPATPKIEDIEHPIARLLQSEGDAEKSWHDLTAEWKSARAQRIKANAAFTTVADFREAKLPEGWISEGEGMQHGWVDDGTPLIALEGEAMVARLLPRGFHTNALSSKLPGALILPPNAPAAGRTISVQMAGGEFGGSLVTIENALLDEAIAFQNTTEPAWKAFAGVKLAKGFSQVTTTLATSSLIANFPPRIGLIKGLPMTDPGYDKRSWISITGIVEHDKAGAPQDPLDQFVSLYELPTPASPEEALQRIGAWLSGAVVRWCDGQPRDGDVRVVNWLLAKKLLPNHAEPESAAAALAEYRRVEAGLAFPHTVNSMDERGRARAAYPINVRGNVDALGEFVGPDFLSMFVGRNDVAKSAGSGRLELAESLLRPDHPLTSRVYVNRVWHWIFGAGLVETPDDFGRLGGKPSHPELLDYLAREFMREGWSTKTLIRRLVLSETFRQGGAVTAAARERDPGNRLLHHYPTRRLEAEGIRDALLAVSGRLDPQLYGRPIEPPRALADPQKRLLSGPLDGDGRRSLYLKMSIMAPPVFLTGFNLPDLKLPTGRRDVTNVPTQALTMLNDPFVSAMAKHWAGQLLETTSATPDERVRAMFVQAFAREPLPSETQRWTAALADFATPGSSDAMHDEAAWAQLAHAFFNTKEFIYYR
jgi:hypothetical protein